MLRFMPDTWRDALLRPIAMADPNVNVYVEIMAPDFRFIFILGLSALLLFSWRRRNPFGLAAPQKGLLLFTITAFVVWLWTSGNGRYFIAVLLLSGTLAIGLLYELPYGKPAKLGAALIFLSVQGFVLHEASPWRNWGLAVWAGEGFFETTLDQQALVEQDVTYVTMSSISYSLLMPRFPQSSRWINISSQQQGPDHSPDGARVQHMLAGARILKLFIPVVVDQMTENKLPRKELLAFLNMQLASQYLSVAQPESCRHIYSKGYADALLKGSKANSDDREKLGFWICDLVYPVRSTASNRQQNNPDVEKIFDLIEQKCPQFFHFHEATSIRFKEGYSRTYPDADIRVYAYDQKLVYYKHKNALNMELIGSFGDILLGHDKLDCNRIRGRSGLPWEREL